MGEEWEEYLRHILTVVGSGQRWDVKRPVKPKRVVSLASLTKFQRNLVYPRFNESGELAELLLPKNSGPIPDPSFFEEFPNELYDGALNIELFKDAHVRVSVNQ